MNASSCSKCRKEPPVYFRQYSGERLCKKCFVRSVEEKAARTISKYSMIRYGERVAVGVSGGKDSLSLLYVLKKFLDEHGLGGPKDLVAVTIDEGIAGYRDESLAIVRNFCGRLGIQNKILSYKELFGVSMDEAMVARPSEKKMSSCSMCGTFRRRAIDLAAESVGADVVATAHNLDDQLQTFMINLLAGDVERIGWIHPQPVEYANVMRKVKPFVELYEHEIVFYALQRDIPFQSEECPYMHESIRTDLREFFNRMEKEHPGIKNNAYASMTKISEKLRASFSEQRDSGRKCALCGRDATGRVCSVCLMAGALASSSAAAAAAAAGRKKDWTF
jgi:uncharacterized protein (TIGR00269 family)